MARNFQDVSGLWALPSSQGAPPTGVAEHWETVLTILRENTMYAFSTVLAYLTTAKVRRDERGATAVEYGLLVALIAAVIIAAVLLLGGKIDGAFDTVNTELGKSNPAPSATP